MKNFYLMVCLSLLSTGKAYSAYLKADVEENTTDFLETIRELGLDEIINDYSDAQKIKINEPVCAFINITGTDNMPQKKDQKMNVWMDVYLGDGNYFRKRAIIDAQGNSSLGLEKKNFKADFCDDEWIGEETPSITIGDWVKQDSYHFKSYYIDYLRGVGVVGYRLYDQMTLNIGRPWTRAESHIVNPKENARCYPDGFPCIVYLNGDFYGIFAWQLKKHRDNMNMKKNIAEHIHLDGYLIDDSFWAGNGVTWNRFEVRNPKNLYNMQGEEYDGNNPTELIDESSPFYEQDEDDESVREYKQRSAQVKKYIINLSQLKSSLLSVEKQGQDVDNIRLQFEKSFDVKSLLDYVCFHLLVNNWDGFAKNWQWFTYDGEKWFVAPYDLDCIFGNWWRGTFIVPADKSGMGTMSFYDFQGNGPFYFIKRYYKADIKRRYIELRNAQIFSYENIKSLLERWYNSIAGFYDDEWLRWPNSKCISETIVNDGWKLVHDNREYYSTPKYSADVLYNPGERCAFEELVWEAIAEVKGVKPCLQLGYRDSLERYEDWINIRIKLLDEYYGYIPNEVVTTECRKNGMADEYVIYDAMGRRRSSPCRGLNIYKYRDGTIRKIVTR